MKDAKLIALVKKLDPNEFKEFGKFIYSPYFNSNKKLERLFECIKLAYPSLSGKKIEKVYIGREVFGESFNQLKINKLMSEMTKLLRKFIAFQSFQRSQIAVNYAEATWYYNNNMLIHFKKISHEIKNKSSTISDLGGFEHLINFLIDYKAYNHPYFSDKTPPGDVLLNANKRLEQYFILSRLKLVFESQGRKKILKEKETLKINSLDKKLIQKHKNDSLISIYNNLISLQKKSDLKLMLEVQTNFTLEIENFLDAEKLVIIYALINHFSFLYHSGNPNLINNIHKLFKLGLIHKIFTLSGKIRHTTFLNICVTSAAAEDFKFLYYFIDTYEAYLDFSVRQDTVNLGFAYGFFHEKQYDRAIDQLNALPNLKLPEYGLRRRNLEIRCFYEKTLQAPKYVNLLIAKIKAFEKYLQRNEMISTNRITGYKNFLHFTKRLIKANETKFDKGEFLKKLNSKKHIVSITWLRKKIKEEKYPSLSPS